MQPNQKKAVFSDVITQERFLQMLNIYEEILVTEGIYPLEALCETLGVDLDLAQRGDSSENKKIVLFSALFRGLFKALTDHKNEIYPEAIDIVKNYLSYVELRDAQVAFDSRSIAAVDLLELSHGDESSGLPSLLVLGYKSYKDSVATLLKRIYKGDGPAQVRREMSAIGLHAASWETHVNGAIIHGIMAVWLDAMLLYAIANGIVDSDFDDLDSDQDGTFRPEDHAGHCDTDADDGDASPYHLTVASQTPKKILH